MIKLNNLTLSYIKEYNTLMNISCVFDQHTLILGSKNDGTHSLFRAIAKIDNEYCGDIFLDDHNIKNIKDRNLDLAYVTSEPYLFKKGIFDNLYYPLKIRKMDKKTTKELIKTVIATHLKDFPNKINDMSITEKKIITLVRAMIRKPKYVLIEDFFNSLDSKYSDLSYTIIQEISKTSIIIACEAEMKPCYDKFTKYSLEYGKLIK